MCLYCKKIAKGGGIHIMKKHLAKVKGDIEPCKYVPPDVRFRMENSLHKLVKSKQAAQEAHECENLYGPNASQFEGIYQDVNMRFNKYKKNPTIAATSSGKRKKNQQ